MNMNAWKQKCEQNALNIYNSLPTYLQSCDVAEAIDWARCALTEHEGKGHSFFLHIENDQFICTFAKPEWASDHAGRPQEEAHTAIVMSVCEYLAGM